MLAIHAWMLISFWNLAHGLFVRTALAKKYEPSIVAKPSLDAAIVLDDSLTGSKCQAKVVVDAGLYRTGTTSFNKWMRSLGYRAFHRLTYFHHYSLGDAYKRNRTDEIYNSLWHEMSHEHGGLALDDAPWPFLACGAAKSQPQKGTAKFIIMERNAIDWHLSLLDMACTYRFDLQIHECAPNQMHCHCKPILEKYDDEIANKFIIRWLEAHWCREALSLPQPSNFCQMRRQQGRSSQAFQEEHPKLAQYMKQHTQTVKACVPPEDLVVVDLYDSYQEKEMKMSKLLGCQGSVPEFPSNSDTGHVLDSEDSGIDDGIL